MHDDVTLATIAGGAVQELFEEELRKIAANILDPNADDGAKRELTLRVRLKPYGREQAAVEVSVSSKLAPVKSVETQFFLGLRDGEPAVAELLVEPGLESLLREPRRARAGSDEDPGAGLPQQRGNRERPRSRLPDQAHVRGRNASP